jgi:alpha-beta hydrolase superfamily lysophospholipase
MKAFLHAGLVLSLALTMTRPASVMAKGGEEDQTLSAQSEEFHFTWNENITINGTIWLPPDGATQGNLAALVHGDGPQDRTSGGGYNPLINALLDQGIAVASWDKPGVGESGGSWFDQSMSDRADETRSAIRKLRQRFEDYAIGAIGFSQAGWVLPRLSVEDDLDYLVLIGPAVNWQDQGDYFGTIRMEAEGKSLDEIEEALILDRANDDIIFNAPTFPNNTTDLTEDRWAFIKRNRHEDSTIFIANLTISTLAMWGEDDLNVNASKSAEIYRKVLKVCSHHPHEVVVIPEATHGLQKSTYNYQRVDQWPLQKQIEWYEEGRFAYAEGALDLLTDWLLQQDHREAGQSDICGSSKDIGSSSSAQGLHASTICSLLCVILGVFFYTCV